MKEYNVFAKFFHNWYFILVLVGEFGLQFLCTECFSVMTRTTPLSKEEWGACLMLGSTSLLISALLKCTPRAWVDKFRVKIVDEDAAVVGSKVLAAFEKVSAIEVGAGGGDADNFKAPAEPEDIGTKDTSI